MSRMLSYFFLIACTLICSASVMAWDKNSMVNHKMYIDEDEFTTKGDAFHVHIAHNVWLVTHTVHRDASGLFAYESDMKRSDGIVTEYERRWKCPYCYQYWPIGTACQNEECPSRYK